MASLIMYSSMLRPSLLASERSFGNAPWNRDNLYIQLLVPKIPRLMASYIRLGNAVVVY